MGKPVIPIGVRAVVPTSGSCAVFLGNDEKVFVIYVDPGVGGAIGMFMNGTPKERPLTHDLMAHIMAALGAKVERTIINDLKTSTFYARLIISVENELQERKLVEIDARPSDSIAIALQQKAPLYVTHSVWDEVDDMSEVLRSMEESGAEPSAEDEES